MCDSCEFYVKRVGDVIEINTILMDKMASVQEDNTCCEAARNNILTIFSSMFLDMNDCLDLLQEAIAETGTDEEKEALRIYAKQYHKAIVKNLHFMKEELFKKANLSTTLDWEGVFGDVLGRIKEN